MKKTLLKLFTVLSLIATVFSLYTTFFATRRDVTIGKTGHAEADRIVQEAQHVGQARFQLQTNVTNKILVCLMIICLIVVILLFVRNSVQQSIAVYLLYLMISMGRNTYNFIQSNQLAKIFTDVKQQDIMLSFAKFQYLAIALWFLISVSLMIWLYVKKDKGKHSRVATYGEV